jgi:hypothetical protein
MIGGSAMVTPGIISTSRRLEPGVIDLHIGAPKTGSTYIQEWLKLNRGKLLENNIYTVSSDASHRIAVEFIETDLRERFDVQEIFAWMTFDEAFQQALSFPRSLISSEYFFLASPCRVTRHFSQAGINVGRVLAFLRRQDVLCASGYAEEVKSLGRCDIVTEVLYSADIDWLALYGKWAASSAENIVFMNYDRHRLNLIDAFLNALGLENRGYESVAAAINISLNAEMTEVARLLNDRGVIFDPSRLAALEGWYPGISFSFSQAITSQFEQIFRRGNEALSTLFPNEFEDLACRQWNATGEDMTGKISEEHLADIISYLD